MSDCSRQLDPIMKICCWRSSTSRRRGPSISTIKTDLATQLYILLENTSYDVIEHILAHENCDVDPINKLDKATPLHLAVMIEVAEVRKDFVESLLEAGADYTIRNKYGETAQDLVKPDDDAVLDLFRQAKAQASISKEDIASDSDDGYDVASDDSE